MEKKNLESFEITTDGFWFSGIFVAFFLLSEKNEKRKLKEKEKEEKIKKKLKKKL